MREKTCAICGKPFDAGGQGKGRSRYCSAGCRREAHLLSMARYRARRKAKRREAPWDRF